MNLALMTTRVSIQWRQCSNSVRAPYNASCTS